ncbi:TetR/AcrR family transcriptional regulator [Nocardia huaxiensis]|uniref:TetR/AcrR family transcriptional regulator n=1 Tax=Nocardia huaxiensis TaxID=2755382 RepID=A0A7D6VAD0_9NOCA|nr:TetR/AcrR family transcriptional regulator [Nocardia huaxiensis]QLY30313.1 TetR/AcrR family transcriptional regulator [Nocardia huaxiensis]UFS96053.1 TetR/AcrR family transcriptional regulator [Nocardia huaxiensis]
MPRPATARSYGGVSAEDRRAERRARLLAAARETWGEAGLFAVTVRGVCKQAGLTDRYFYEHFANRDELLAAVADALSEELLTILVQAGVTAPGSAEDKLHAALRAFLEAVAGDPRIHRIISTETGTVPALAQRRREVLTTIADLVVQNAPEAFPGDHDPDSLRRAALFVTGGVNQLIDGWLDGAIDLSADELALDCARLCVSVLERATRTGSFARDRR